jgi:glycosyltransferase involved in cell wall biosynthesis
MRLLYAPSVHQGGGKVLLLMLMKELSAQANIAYVIDDRLDIPVDYCPSGYIRRVRPTIFSRLLAELYLLSFDRSVRVLCFGNLPPLFATFDQCTVFVQNRYLVDKISLKGFRFLTRLRLMTDRAWLKLRANTVGQFLVQTETMRRKLYDTVHKESKVIPLMPDQVSSSPVEKGNTGDADYDFIYVASGEPHKNHHRLVEAWILLAKSGKAPSLCLTLDQTRFPELVNWIKTMVREHGLEITIIDEVTTQEISVLYRKARALIYPSLFESFGLPLLEADSCGLPLLTADRDYVHDVVIPTAVFDPMYAESIADTVSRFSYQASQVKIRSVGAAEFLQHVNGWADQ